MNKLDRLQRVKALEKRKYAILDKMVAVIKSASDKSHAATHNYVCYANRELSRLCSEICDLTGEASQTFGVVGASIPIRRLYEDKFGRFIGVIMSTGASAHNGGEG